MRLSDYIPILSWARNYPRTDLRHDLQAGLTIGIMVIPSGMAYGMLAGLPPIYGLYTAMIPMLLYALLGTSRQLVIGPAAVIAILVASGVGTIADHGTADYIGLTLLLTLMVGVIQVVLGALRLGFLANFLSHPVLSGFISAASVIIIFSQLRHLTGIDIDRSHLVHKIFLDLLRKIGDLHWLTLVVGVGGMLVISISRRIHKSLPAAIFAVVLGILIVYILGLYDRGVRVVGDVPSGLPVFTIPEISGANLTKLLPTALTIALISILESIVIAKAMVRRFRNGPIVPNQEFRAVGIANVAGAFFQAFPVAGSFSRTAINAEAGGKTGFSSLIGAISVAITLLVLTPLFYYLPNAILASVIIMAVINLIDFREPRFLWKSNKTDFWMLMTTFLATLFIGIEEGILIGVVLSLVMVIYKSTRPHIALLGRVPGSLEFRNVERFDDLEINEKILVVRFDAPLYFANADQFRRKLAEMRRGKVHLELIIIDASSITDMDSTAIHLLQELVEDYKNENIEVFFTSLRGPVRDALAISGFSQTVGTHRFYLSVEDAIQAFISGSSDAFPKYSFQTNQ